MKKHMAGRDGCNTPERSHSLPHRRSVIDMGDLLYEKPEPVASSALSIASTRSSKSASSTNTGEHFTAPIDIKGSHSFEARPVTDGDKEEAELRKWCTGQPPKASGFGPLHDSPPRGRHALSRRSTLADKPELDALLSATMKLYEGEKYLPLSIRTLHRLSPFWKGEKPIADFSIFERLLLNKDVNMVHADHVVSALERIGQYCKHLVVVAPIRTDEYGEVFNREEGNISTGNDWYEILACFPNLETVIFEQPEEVPSELTRSTFANFQRTVHGAKIKLIKMSVPPQAMNDLHANFLDHPRVEGPPATSEDEDSQVAGSMD